MSEDETTVTVPGCCGYTAGTRVRIGPMRPDGRWQAFKWWVYARLPMRLSSRLQGWWPVREKPHEDEGIYTVTKVTHGEGYDELHLAPPINEAAE